MMELVMLAALAVVAVTTLSGIVSYTVGYWWTRGQYNAFKDANDLSRTTQRG